MVADFHPEGGPPDIRTIFNAQAALLGFALSADGSKLWIGGPKDGVQLASTTDFQFASKSKLEIQCLTIADDGLWACSNEKSGFVAGLSKDEGATFEAKLHFCDIRGPLACAAGAKASEQCAASWPAQKSQLGCGGGMEGEAGANPFDGGAKEPPVDDPKCDCNAVRPVSPWAGAFAAAAALGALVRRLRRR
jgi:hypothetical protein